MTNLYTSNNSESESKLIDLNPLSKNDFPLFKKIYTNAELMCYIGNPLSIEKVQRLFAQALKQRDKEKPKYIYYVISMKKSGKTVGLIGLLWNQKLTTTIEIGIIIQKSYQNQGVAKIAMKMLIHKVFKESSVTKIIGLCHRQNSRVNTMMLNLGFTTTKTTKDKNKNTKKILWEITRDITQTPV